MSSSQPESIPCIIPEEDPRFSDEETSPTSGLGIRHLQCLMCFLALALMFTNNICMSIAIVAMGEEEKNKSKLTSDHIGLILSAPMWGSPLVQVPVGHLARIWSAKSLLSIGILTNGIFGLLCPIVFDRGGWIYLCICRVVMGMCRGCLKPCIHTLLARWVPPNERGRLAGWRCPFYVFGAIAVVWSMIFFLMGSDSPVESSDKTCCSISQSEKDYIQRGLGVFEERANYSLENSTPWRAILTSRPFWALLIANCGYSWGFWVLLTEIPIYMAGVLRFDIKENGVKSALPYVALLLLTFPVSWMSDWCEKKGVSRGVVRKVCNTIGYWGPAVALVGICFVSPDDRTAPVVLLVLAVGLNAGGDCGYQINHMDLSHKYAGVLVSITNSAASFVALLGPLIVSQIVTDTTNAYQWKTVFYMTGGIYFLSNLIFILFGSGEHQTWDNIHHERL
ncbi:putative inorganic phosphate cotransporter isoform X2 [Fopius arisanus]|uniref:Inorganic phosphate cotransporter isoform X2 n=1 Tax=Fopius arisanus TaxID=64838 RepID=A0A9R1U620_9HYME|nr:PREDICTED: putative inorganic phosphate cotransporter isoform X2 [Fopius arisanus]